jgi:hypothetical protein
MGDLKYISRVRIERISDGLRRAHIPGEPEPVSFGFHGAIAEYYGVAATDRERATTLDYVVAAAGG